MNIISYNKHNRKLKQKKNPPVNLLNCVLVWVYFIEIKSQQKIQECAKNCFFFFVFLFLFLYLFYLKLIIRNTPLSSSPSSLWRFKIIIINTVHQPHQKIKQSLLIYVNFFCIFFWFSHRMWLWSGMWSVVCRIVDDLLLPNTYKINKMMKIIVSLVLSNNNNAHLFCHPTP